MKNMREMINLMEGVMAIPGLRQVREDESDMQTASTAADGEADANFDAAQEVEESVPAVASCQQTNPEDAVIACAMEGTGYDMDFVASSVRQMYDYATSEDELRKMVAGETGYGDNPEFNQMFDSALAQFLNGDDTSFDDIDGPDDFSADADALASAGHGSDEDYGDFPIDEARGSDINPEEVKALSTMQVDAAKARAHEIIAASRTGDNRKSYLANQVNRARSAMDVTSLMYNMILAGEGNAVQGSNYSKKFGVGNTMEEAFDLQNGYDDVDVADGNDYFPNGADSPVVSKVGPSGARQGDNPEQKKMQVAEVHKELVYGYRNFLKEAAVTQKKS